MFGPPTSSRMTSNGPCSSKPSGSIALTSSASIARAVLGVADGGGDARAGHLAELDGGHADAAGGAVDEQALAERAARPG